MKRLLVALLLIGAVAGGAPAVAAQSDDGGILSDFLDDESESDWAATLGGVTDKMLWQASQYVSFSDAEEDQQTAEADRADLQQTFNANSESIENYTNARFGGNASAWNVIEITHIRDDGNATQYLVADVTNGTFHNATMVNTTERTVDHEVTLEGYASDAAHEELDTFVSAFVTEDKDVTIAYTTRLATEYSGYVDRPEALTND